MSLFGKARTGFMDEIRCDEPSYLIWKWHPSGVQSGESRRENSIRWGSSLRVKDGEVAVFVYRQKDGTMQDYIEGPFDRTLETANFPVLASIVGFAFGGGTPFQAEVYFINLARIIQVRFGVPFFDVYDPRFTDFAVPVAVRGTINFKIRDYREFIKLHRLGDFDLKTFQAQIKDAVIRYVKDTVANAPAEHNIPVVQIESKTSLINDIIEYDIAERLRDSFGVEVSGVDIGAIEIDKASDSYAQLMAVTKDVTTAAYKAHTEAQVKDIRDKQRINAENYEETLRAQREEAQYARHMQTQSENFAAFQVGTQTQVGVAGANALGQMGANGAGSVDLGGAGFNPAAMMTGMALGGAVGQNIANTMNGIMAGTNQQTMSSNATPPPVPSIAYHVVLNGQASGPFDLSVLNQMAVLGQFTKDSLVWKAGMNDWAKAETVAELKSILNNVIPPLPPTV